MHRLLQFSFIFAMFVSFELFPQWTGVTSPVTEGLKKVQFLDNNLGWIAGESSVLKTTDGGTTWVSFNTNISDTRGMFAISSSTAWICGTFGKISKTTDGGATWVAQTTGLGQLQSAEGLYFHDQNNGWAACQDGILLKTTDGGTTWQKITTTVTSTLRTIKFKDNNNGWAGGGPAFLRTTDGGITWTKINGFASVRDIHFLDANTGFVSDTWGQDNLVLKTTDGGITWQATTTISTGPYYFHGVFFTDVNTGYVVGRTMFFLQNYGIYKTTDGGTTWTAQTTNPVPMFENFRSVTFTPNGTGWAVGDNGAIYKLTGTTSVNEYQNIPVEFALHQNFPNPFNPSTTFSFNLQSDGQTDLVLYNIQGEKIATLISEHLAAGQYKRSFDFTSMGMSSGVYLFRLNHTGIDGKESSSTKKLTLLK